MQDNKWIINFQNKIIKLVNDLIDKKLSKIGSDWHLGKIDSVVNAYKAYVFVDGGTTSQLIPTNPDVTFAPNQEVFVLFINGDSKAKYVPFKRSIEP